MNECTCINPDDEFDNPPNCPVHGMQWDFCLSGLYGDFMRAANKADALEQIIRTVVAKAGGTVERGGLDGVLLRVRPRL